MTDIAVLRDSAELRGWALVRYAKHVKRLRSKLSAITRLHLPTDTSVCEHCGYDWPCPTVQAMREEHGL